MATSTQWQLDLQSAEQYQQVLVPTILGPAAWVLVDWVDIQAGDTVVDVGCGTGAATVRAADRVGSSGRVIGIDINAGMVAVARSHLASSRAVIEWYVESVYQLPLDDGTADVVLCAQTLQFLKNQPAALAEMERILKQNGLVAYSTWCAPQENPYFQALVETITRHIGPDVAAGLNSIFGLSKADEIYALLSHAGFKDIEIIARTLELEIPPLEDFLFRHIHATPMAGGFTAAGPAVQNAILQDVSTALQEYAHPGNLWIPFRTYLAKARRR